jgi:hypothetical protein
MQILWKNHPSDKTKNGTTEHVAREFAIVALGYQQAEAVPFPRRGAPGWLEAMAEREKDRKPGPHDVCVANVWPPTWEVISLPRTNKPCIVYRAGSEVTRFESLYWYEPVAADADGNWRDPIKHDLIPPSCPDSIVRHFKELEASTSPEAIAAANERAAQEKIRAEQHERTRSGRMLAKLGL